MIIFKSKDELKHYASKYYDPVKAHEYYMRTRQLKGRRSTKSLDEEGKLIWNDVKKNVLAERQQAQRAVQKQKSDEIKAFKDKVRAEQKARAERNADYLKSQIKKSMAEEKAKLAQLAKTNIQKVKKTIPLKRIPKTASPQQKERIRAENDRIRGENARIRDQNDSIRSRNTDARAQAASEKALIKDDYREVRADYKDECRKILDSIKDHYKEKISDGADAIKEKYAGSRDEIKQKYEDILDEEYAKILSEHGADTAKGQNTGAITQRSAEERKKIREQLAAERERERKKKK